MNPTHDTSPKAHSVRDWLARHLVQPVPPELGACEFACTAEQCSHEEWTRCSRRKLAAETAGNADPEA